MGTRILENEKDGMAVLYDSVTEVAFGPIIRDWEPAERPASEEDVISRQAGEVAEAFLEWMANYYPDEGHGFDVRQMLPADVVTEYGNFLAELERDGWDTAAAEYVADPGRLVAVREDGSFRYEEDSDRKYDLAKESGEL